MLFILIAGGNYDPSQFEHILRLRRILDLVKHNWRLEAWHSKAPTQRLVSNMRQALDLDVLFELSLSPRVRGRVFLIKPKPLKRDMRSGRSLGCGPETHLGK